MLVVYIRVPRFCSMDVLLLEGLPKALNNTSYDFLKSRDGHFLLELNILN